MFKCFTIAFVIFPTTLLSQEINTNNEVNCGFNKQARNLAKIIINSENQQRKQLLCNEMLAKLADKKAKQMAEVDRIRHDIYHVSPNQFLRTQGFALPALYEIVGNQVEAVSGGMETAQETFDYFMTSIEHKKHLLGENDFYMAQNQIGVGFYEDVSKKYEQYWVVYITKKQGGDDKPRFKVKYKIKVDSNYKDKKERKRYNPKNYDFSKYKGKR